MIAFLALPAQTDWSTRVLLREHRESGISWKLWWNLSFTGAFRESCGSIVTAASFDHADYVVTGVFGQAFF